MRPESIPLCLGARQWSVSSSWTLARLKSYAVFQESEVDNTNEEESVLQRVERTDEVALWTDYCQETKSFDV